MPASPREHWAAESHREAFCIFLSDPCVLCERYLENYALNAIDWYNPDKEPNTFKSETTLNLGFESALIFGEWDIDECWPKHKEEFLKGTAYG